MTTNTSLLLASASPRRRQLITHLGLPTCVTIAPVDEDALQVQYQGPAEGMAQWTAYHKAMGALQLPEATDRLVVAADTTVILDDQVLNKPRDEAHAYQLLSALRGRWHRVVTGLVVTGLVDGKIQTHAESCTTPVLMRSYSDQEILAYIATGDPMDKAGAYGIQHPNFQPTERIAGCYLNVVGLPLCTLTKLLAIFQVVIPAQEDKKSACRWSERCLI